MWDKYDKVKKLGEGGMGEVWLVHHKSARTLFAAKVLRRDLVRAKDYSRFQRELSALTSLDHPNVIKVFDVSDDPSQPGYVMQYCPDGSLEDQIRAGVADARAILPPLCGAVKCVHAHGLIHRDIKPGNILISPMGQILLADFGLAVNDDLGRTSLTTSNWCSQGFAPPEQYRDMRSVTKRADIFAIGAIYYYIKTGRKIDVTSELSSQLSGLLGFDRYFLSRSLAFEEGERLGDVDHITGILDKGLEESGVFDFLNLGPQERLNALDQKMKAVTPVIDNMDAGERLLRWMQCILPLEPDACVLQSLRDRIKTLDDDWGEAFGTVFREGGNDV